MTSSAAFPGTCLPSSMHDMQDVDQQLLSNISGARMEIGGRCQNVNKPLIGTHQSKPDQQV
jgi:hypothetical protein